MKILLDTQIFLWAILEPHRISPAMRSLLVDPDHDLLLSTVSIWEIGIKYSIGKLPLKLPPELLIPQQMRLQNIQPLPLLLEHALHAHTLPQHHRDPFDRMLIAQAMAEGLPLMTGRSAFPALPGENSGVKHFHLGRIVPIMIPWSPSLSTSRSIAGQKRRPCRGSPPNS